MILAKNASDIMEERERRSFAEGEVAKQAKIIQQLQQDLADALDPKKKKKK
jgi:hypothetical protein